MRVRVPTGRAKMFPVPDDQNLSAMRAYYELGEEEARLADGAVGHLEFERTKEIVLRHLPPPPAVVADIGGGPGRYSHWLAEARRIARPGGPVFAAAINRWAMRLDDVLRRRRYQQIPDLEEKLEPLERTGRITPLYPGSFVGYTHRPEELRAEVRAAGLQLASLVSVEGPAFLLGDLPERLADPGDRRVVLDTIRALEQVPELLGAGTHLLATAHAEPHPA
jgi:hypothetical protein